MIAPLFCMHYIPMNVSGHVVIKSLATSKQWDQFEKYLCKNMSQGLHCDVSSLITQSYMSTSAALEPPHLKLDAYKVVHSAPDGLPFTVCLSDGVLDQLTSIYALGVGDPSEKQKSAQLYTSLVINQEGALSR